MGRDVQWQWRRVVELVRTNSEPTVKCWPYQPSTTSTLLGTVMQFQVAHLVYPFHILYFPTLIFTRFRKVETGSPRKQFPHLFHTGWLRHW